MRISDIFQLFSKRRRPGAQPLKPLSAAFRQRVLMRCRDALGDPSAGIAFLRNIQRKLSYLHGRLDLAASSGADSREPSADLLKFLTECSDDHFLDFVEAIFQVEWEYRLPNADGVVEDINEFFRIDDLPYALTGFVWTTSTVSAFGGLREGQVLSGYPQVILRSSELLHETAIAPAIQLLREPRFAHANAEFLGALADQRHRRYAEALTKVGSAFESVLKVICATRGWSYSDNETAAPLLKKVLTQAGLESFWEQPLTIVATMRNRLSSAHGAGTAPRNITPARCDYAISATAAAMLLLAQET